MNVMSFHQHVQMVYDRCRALQEMIQKAIAENARVALDQKEYNARFDELSQRFDALEKQHNELERQIADRISRQTAMR